jgi:hypothetical protein
MAPRKNTAAVNLVALEQSAIVAVKSIESGYSAASKAIMAYVLGAKESNATPPMFDAGIARISDAIPGVAKITVGAYISNARRIFAASKDDLAKAVDAAGTDSIKALAAACPVVSRAKADGQTKRAEEKKASAPATPAAPAVTVSTPASDPILMASNALVAMRKLATSKKKARIILATIGEIEDMLDEIKSLMAA